MSGYDDRLKDYVDVKQRIALFKEQYPGGSLVTTKVKVTREPDDVPRVWVQAKAYRTDLDPLPGVGWSWMILPGSTPYTRGSELENVETSAWGRAIGALGIGIEKSIASADEVRNKEEPLTPASVNAEERVRLSNTTTIHSRVQVGDTVSESDGLIGTAIAQGTQDFNLRQTPDGFVLPFRVKNGSKSFIVLAENKLAEALDVIKTRVIGERVTVWGHWTDETIPAKGTKPKIEYRVLHLERIETPDGMLPPDNRDGPALPTAEMFTGPEFDK